MHSSSSSSHSYVTQEGSVSWGNETPVIVTEERTRATEVTKMGLRTKEEMFGIREGEYERVDWIEQRS